MHSKPVDDVIKPQNLSEKYETDIMIRRHAENTPRTIHLQNLVKFKDVSPIPENALLENAAEVIQEVTVRLGRRLRALQDLPFLVVLNPKIARLYGIYYNSFRVMSSFKPPKSIKENKEFVDVLHSLVSVHSDTVPLMAYGYQQAIQRNLLNPKEVNSLINEHINARIGTRLLAEHHIALTNPIGPNFVGCIQKDLCPADKILECARVAAELCSIEYGATPTVKFDMGTQVKLAYSPNHLEYMVMEVLKNAFRALCESNHADIPVLVTVIQSGQGVIIRVRDRGGGAAPSIEQHLFQFAYSTVEQDSNDQNDPSLNPLAGLGFGLPLSKAYAEYFGGKLQLQTYDGLGTDVYLTLKSPMLTGYSRDVE